MKAELLLVKNIYEIWVDDQYVSAITPRKGEKSFEYKMRAEKSFEDYIESMRNLKAGTTRKVVKTTII
jgi:hypothetical protein